MSHHPLHVAPVLRRSYWLAGAAMLALAITGVLTFEANRRDDQAVVDAFNRSRLGRNVQTLARDRAERLRAFSTAGDPEYQMADERDRRTMLAKLDSLASLDALSAAEDSIVREVHTKLTLWDSALVVAGSATGGVDSVHTARADLLFRQVRERFVDLEDAEDAAFAGAMARTRWLRITRNASVIIELCLMVAGLFVAHRVVMRQMSAVVESQHEVLDRLAAAAEYRDDDSGRHTQRVGELAARIARGMGYSAERAETIRRAAALHDVGKIGVPDSILLKRGKLTAEELDVVRQHTVIGARILEGSRCAIVAVAASVARSHHERWDGSGYPDRLAGNDIPIEARIAAVADVFDAIRSKRPYRDAFALEVSLEEIRRGAGTQFDPNVVQAFFQSRCYDGYAVEGGESQDAETRPPLIRQLANVAAVRAGESGDGMLSPTLKVAG
jgi:HD-GYP domain-containing protein (c-di-GMP phosphodiesterase class II)